MTLLERQFDWVSMMQERGLQPVDLAVQTAA
jgi:hypothetical protein